MRTRKGMARIVVSAAAIIGLVLGGMLFADAAYAATTVSITPSSTTVASGTPVTYTLNFACSGTPAGCGTSTVSFPTTAITGNGTTTDFGSWVTAGTCPALTKSGGVASFDVTSFIGTTNASQQCTFKVTPPDFKTLNGAVATITPTLTTANGGNTTGAGITLTSTATQNASFIPTATSQVVSGGGMSYSLFFKCSAAAAKTGDVGVNQITMTAQLPANFTYTGFAAGVALSGTVSAPPANSQGGTFSYTSNGSECAVPPLSGTATGFAINVNGNAASAGGSDPNGDVVTATTSASWTYIDGTPGSAAPAQVSTTVIVLNTTALKSSSTNSPLGNAGQYKFGSTSPTYTFPGDWDATHTNAEWDIALQTAPTAVINGGAAYGVQDPMPCLDGGPSGAKIYDSKAPGATCASPGFVPTVITATGFTRRPVPRSRCATRPERRAQWLTPPASGRSPRHPLWPRSTSRPSPSKGPTAPR